MSDHIDGLIAQRARAAAAARLNRVMADTAAYESANSPEQVKPPTPEASPGAPGEGSGTPLAGVGAMRLEGTAAERLARAGAAARELNDALNGRDPNRLPENPAPTSPMQSSSEEVRYRAGVSAPVDLRRAVTQGAGEAARQIPPTGEGLATKAAELIGVELENKIPQWTEQFGIPRNIMQTVLDAALPLLNMPSAAAGGVVSQLLKESGVNPETADKAGMAVELATSAVFAATTGGEGVGAFKPFKPAPKDTPEGKAKDAKDNPSCR